MSSKLLQILCAFLTIFLRSGESRYYDKSGLILALVQKFTDFSLDEHGESAYLEYIDVNGPVNFFPLHERKVEVNYSSLTNEPYLINFPLTKWVEMKKVELSFEKYAGDVRAARLIFSRAHSPDVKYLVVEVPPSREPDNLLVDVYAKMWIDYDH